MSLVFTWKDTFVPEPRIPVDGWPNVEAQLWCYSWIDEFVTAKDVIMVGQLWHRHFNAIQLCYRHPYWRRSDGDHQAR